MGPWFNPEGAQAGPHCFYLSLNIRRPLRSWTPGSTRGQTWGWSSNKDMLQSWVTSGIGVRRGWRRWLPAPCDWGEDGQDYVHLLGLPLHMGQLQTADSYCLTILETRSSKSRCWQGPAPSAAWRGASFLVSSVLCWVMSNSLWPGSSVRGDSLGKNTGVGFHAFLQEIFPTQGSNPGLSLPAFGICQWSLVFLWAFQVVQW